jgi:hypothetical protein
MNFRPSPAVAAIFIASLLAACGPADKPVSAVTPGAPDATSGPVALSPHKSSPQTIAMTVDQDALTKAIERLRITKKKGESPFDQAGADLNSTGRAKALVLFTGTDWCSPQGCTLVVFEPGETGFKPVSQIVGVKAPVAAGPGSNAGWRDLIVKTGASKIVRLTFTGGGYPTNAAGQPDASADVPQSEVLIQPQGSLTAAAAPPSGGPAPR